MITKRIAVLIVTITVVAFIIGTVIGIQIAPEPGIHLRLSYQPSIHQLAHMVAMEKGWWLDDLRKFGVVRVTEYVFPSGPPQMSAMMAGDLDVAYVGATPPITAIDKGLDAKIVAGAQIQGSALALRPEIAKEYTGPADLKELKIATFPPGSIQDTVLKHWLIKHGIDPKEVDIVPMGPGEAVTAIAAGAVDGVFLPHPGPTIVELEGSGVIVENSGEMWEKHSCCVLLVSGKLIQEHPEIVKEIIKIHIRAVAYSLLHPEEAAEIYEKKVGWAAENVLHAFRIWDGWLIVSPYEGLEHTLEYARVIYEELGATSRLLTKEDLYDTRFYDEVKEELMKELPKMENLARKMLELIGT